MDEQDQVGARVQDVEEGPELTSKQFDLVLSTRGATKPCEACGASDWYFVQHENHMAVTATVRILELGSEKYGSSSLSPILSSYTKLCLNCGHMLDFSRAAAKNMYKKIAMDAADD